MAQFVSSVLLLRASRRAAASQGGELRDTCLENRLGSIRWFRCLLVSTTGLTGERLCPAAVLVVPPLPLLHSQPKAPLAPCGPLRLEQTPAKSAQRCSRCVVASCFILKYANKGRSRCWLNHARLVTLSGRHVVWRQCFPLRVVFPAAAISGVLR